jgi:DNA-binding transcriptional ArsR family regulator
MSLEQEITKVRTLRSAQDFADAADLLKALGHPLRLRIVTLLAKGREHVGALAARLEVPQAIASQQLRILRMSGLVAATRDNGQAVYRLIDPRVVRLIRCMESSH